MATVGREIPPPNLDENPFFFGFRAVERVGASGSIALVNVPLTEEDALHPREGDHIARDTRHLPIVFNLWFLFRGHFRDDPSVAVLSDNPVDWEIPGLGSHSPDVFVVRFARPAPNWRGELHMKSRRAAPLLLIEVTSSSTRRIDFEGKMDEYQRAGVPQYVILDLQSDPPTLHDYRLTPRGYARGPKDRSGRIRLLAPDMRMGLLSGRPRMWDARTNRALLWAPEIDRLRRRAEDLRRAALLARDEAEARLSDEARARQAAEERVRELEAELRRRQGDLP